MSIDAHLPRAVPTAAVVADEVGVVVSGRVGPDGVFELGDDSQRGEGASAVWRWADDAFGGDVGDGNGDAFEERCVFAETAFERESSAVFEPDRIRNLTLQWADLLRLVRGRRRSNAVFLRVETETFS